jgi:RHS repeat-associated protein
VIASLDSSTGALSKIGYLPYGKSAGAPSSFGFTGQRSDPEANGFYYYRARHYSPGWGRFLQADPIGYQGGSNLYAYVENDTLNLTDPFGLCPGCQNANPTNQLIQNDAITSVYPIETAIAVAAAAATGGVSAAASRIMGAIIGEFFPSPALPPNMGDLTAGEIGQIQSTVNQAGRPLEVVGSAASGARQAGSDIDYIAPPSSLPYYEGLQGQLPGIDPTHGIIPGVGNRNIGPVIRFEPR